MSMHTTKYYAIETITKNQVNSNHFGIFMEEQEKSAASSDGWVTKREKMATAYYKKNADLIVNALNALREKN